MLVIQIDVESLEENIKSEIIQDMKTELSSPIDNISNNYLKLIYDNSDNDEDNNSKSTSSHNIKAIILEENEKHINKIKHKIKDLFINKAIDEYIVIKDEIDNSKIIILKRTHAESKGLYHCRHCGMEFEDEIQLSSHLRMHFFI
jgi:hypothetical protein